MNLYKENGIQNPVNSPNDETVGRIFNGWSTEDSKSGSTLFYCFAYDPRCGYWMIRTKTDKSLEIRNISERAVGRTWHKKTGTDANSLLAEWYNKRPWEDPKNYEIKF